MTLPRLLVLSLGGTITMTPNATGGGIAPTMSAADLVGAIPGLGKIADIDARSALMLPSPSLTLEHICTIAAEIRAAFDAGFDGAVVIQGTDTIEETAFALDVLVRDEKPIIVTGAMRGPLAPGAEGPANILAACLVAGSGAARGLGALVVLNDEIHAARYVRKTHTALPSAFVSAQSGPLGLVAEGAVRLFTRVTPAVLPELAGEGDIPPVALLKIAMGDDGRLVRAVPSLSFKGMVIEGMGAGHVPGDIADIVAEVASQIAVVLATRTLNGPVFSSTYGYPGSEIDLLAKGLIPAGLLQGPKARLLLALCLRAGLPREQIAAAFNAYG